MIIFILTTLVFVGLGILLIPWWIRVYNQFQLYYTKAEREFADVDVVMQQRLDNIQALANSVITYDSHEKQVIRDAVEARSHWEKDIPLNDKIGLIPQIEDAYMKLKAVAERYPNLKANEVHLNLMQNDTQVEIKLRETRFAYNGTAQEYNQRTRFFPTSIVATVHNLRRLKYITFKEQEAYKPKTLLSADSKDLSAAPRA